MPCCCAAFTKALEIPGARWDRVLRLARMTGLHGRLAAANADNPTVSERVRRHLLSATGWRTSARACSTPSCATWPRCAAAISSDRPEGQRLRTQALGFARGRFVSDIDLLVHTRPAPWRAGLHAAGWEARRWT